MPTHFSQQRRTLGTAATPTYMDAPERAQGSMVIIDRYDVTVRANAARMLAEKGRAPATTKPVTATTMLSFRVPPGKADASHAASRPGSACGSAGLLVQQTAGACCCTAAGASGSGSQPVAPMPVPPPEAATYARPASPNPACTSSLSQPACALPLAQQTGGRSPQARPSSASRSCRAAAASSELAAAKDDHAVEALRRAQSASILQREQRRAAAVEAAIAQASRPLTTVSKITANAAAAAAATANEIRARSDRDHSEIRAATYQPAEVESTVPTEQRLVSRLPLYTGYDQPAADRDHGYRLQEVLSPGAAAMFAQEAAALRRIRPSSASTGSLRTQAHPQQAHPQQAHPIRPNLTRPASAKQALWGEAKEPMGPTMAAAAASEAAPATLTPTTTPSVPTTAPADGTGGAVMGATAAALESMLVGHLHSTSPPRRPPPPRPPQPQPQPPSALWGAPDGVKSVPVATAAAGMPPSAASAASAASPPAVRYTPIAAANGHAEAARWERQEFPTHSGMPRRVHSEQLDAMLTSLLSKLEVRGELEFPA
jgi:hypothetical protein